MMQASKTIRKRRLNWCGHVMRRYGEHILRKVLTTVIQGKRLRERPKTRWRDACQRDLKNTGLRAGENTDRAMCRRKIISCTGDPTCIDGKSQGKEEECMCLCKYIIWVSACVCMYVCTCLCFVIAKALFISSVVLLVIAAAHVGM